MADETGNLILERMRRTDQTIADFRSSLTGIMTTLTRTVGNLGDRVERIEDRITGVERAMHDLRSEVISIGINVENALKRATDTDRRLGSIEDANRSGKFVVLPIEPHRDDG